MYSLVMFHVDDLRHQIDLQDAYRPSGIWC